MSLNVAGIGPAGIDPQVAALAPSQLAERLCERGVPGLPLGIVRGDIREHADAPHALLRARRERPRDRRAAEQRDELAAFHCPMPPVLLTERIAHLSYGRRLLRCGISTAPMSRWRHPRPRRTKPHVIHLRFAPKATVGH